jgi:hypothetical protein
MKAELELPPAEALALEAYERTMVANRTSARGRVVGSRIHVLVRITPIVVPIGFSLLWLYAYWAAPHLAR